MQETITFKRSPIVLIWKFAAVEAAGFFLYFIATLFGNAKYEIYTQLSFSSFLSYQVAKMILLYGAQFMMTVYAFLSWHYDIYKISRGLVTRERGVFLKMRTSFLLDESASYQISSGLLGKLLHYGSICIKENAARFSVKTVSRPADVLAAIAKQNNPYFDFFDAEPDLARLLAQEEHEQLEFKSSLRFDYAAGRVSRELEKAAMKTIAAFLNSKGGYLIIGVNDRREPLGLHKDYATLQRKDSDGFEIHFTQAFNSAIGPEFRELIKLWFHKSGDSDICVIQVLPAPRPVYLKIDNNEHFYMRTGNISTNLKLSEMESYARTRWPRTAVQA